MTELSLRHVASGKVRDIYELDDKHLLFVTSDRMSAFDVVMAEPIPDKGRVLTALTAFWLERLAGVAPNHLVSLEVPAAVTDRPSDLEGRVMVVRKAEMLPVECIVRGYLSGSAWAEYRKSQTMHGQQLPAGLRQSERLPEPVFTPSTKATSGHDENISFTAAADLVGIGAGRASPPGQPGCLRHGGRHGGGAGHHYRRHQVRTWIDRRRSVHLRRGVDTGFIPVLAGG